jgi:arginyl-tRNA synthetase
MNIFKLYRDKIVDILKSANQESLIKLPENLNSINVDIPPSKFNCDISTNVAMVLSKTNEKSPIEIAQILTKLIKENDHYIDDILIAKPGFINLKLNKDFWNYFLKNIINDKSYGSQKLLNQKKYLDFFSFK